MKRFVSALACVLLMASAAFAASPKDTFVYESYGTVRTLDPACAYDVVSHQRIMNIYEGLIFFDGSATDKFKPVLATEVPSVENGGIRDGGKLYEFKIRKGVTFHDGSAMTPEDVAYSIKRHMIVDQDGGPSWMMLAAVTGIDHTRKDGKVVPGIFEKIDKAVTVKGDSVLITLPKPFPPLLAVLAYSYGGVVMNKDWAIAHGGWDGKIENAAKYNDPAFGTEPFQKVANGTGAYKMLKWVPSNEFIFTRNENYWGEKPELKTAIVRYNKEWSSRKLALQNGDADRVEVDAQYLSEVQDMANVKLFSVPQLSITGAMFTQNINPVGNPNIGSGKLDGEGIPVNFFADINVRKAFLHAFDRQLYREDVWNGDVLIPTSPNAQGLPYVKEEPIYEYDLEKAAECMKKAFDGKLWEKGFKMVITHNTGNDQRGAAALMLAENISSLNPKFQIEVRNVDWKDYTVAYRKRMFPIFIIGWGADYPDPDNFLATFMGSNGVYGKYMDYKNPEVDELIVKARYELDPEKRKEMYYRIQDFWYEDAPGIVLYQKVDHFAYRSNIDGFVPNPLFDVAWENLKLLKKN